MAVLPHVMGLYNSPAPTFYHWVVDSPFQVMGMQGVCLVWGGVLLVDVSVDTRCLQREPLDKVLKYFDKIPPDARPTGSVKGRVMEAPSNHAARDCGTSPKRCR